MRIQIACLALLVVAPSSFAQAEPPETMPVDEFIQSDFPDVYAVSITIDRRLEAYPVVMTALREAELNGLANFAALAIEDHQIWMNEAPDWSWNEYFSETRISVSFANASVVSLDRRASFYTGGAHPNQGMTPVVTRTNSFDPAGLDDLISDTMSESPALTALFYAVYRELMALKRERLGVDFDEVMERETWLSPLAAELDAFPGFTLIPNQTGTAAAGLMFHFEPYAVGSYAEGSYDVPVPLSVFERYLTDAWQEIFEGEPLRPVLTEAGDALEPIIPESEE